MAKKPAVKKPADAMPLPTAAHIPEQSEPEVVETLEQPLEVQSIADTLATMPVDISAPEKLEAAKAERASERVSRATADRNKYGRAH